MHFIHVTGSEFGNEVLIAYSKGEIPFPFATTTISDDGRATVTDIEGNPLSTLQAKHEELYGLYGSEFFGGRESKKSTEN